MVVSRQPVSKTGEGVLERATVPRNPDKGRAKGRDAKGTEKREQPSLQFSDTTALCCPEGQINCFGAFSKGSTKKMQKRGK